MQKKALPGSNNHLYFYQILNLLIITKNTRRNFNIYIFLLWKWGSVWNIFGFLLLNYILFAFLCTGSLMQSEWHFIKREICCKWTQGRSNLLWVSGYITNICIYITSTRKVPAVKPECAELFWKAHFHMLQFMLAYTALNHKRSNFVFSGKDPDTKSFLPGWRMVLCRSCDVPDAWEADKTG